MKRQKRVYVSGSEAYKKAIEAYQKAIDIKVESDTKKYYKIENYSKKIIGCSL